MILLQGRMGVFDGWEKKLKRLVKLKKNLKQLTKAEKVKTRFRVYTSSCFSNFS